MISEALIRFFSTFVNYAIDLMPTAHPPSWITGASGTMRTVWATAGGLGAWIPWDVLGTVIQTVLICMALGLALKIARIVASFFTVGGGSAG